MANKKKINVKQTSEDESLVKKFIVTLIIIVLVVLGIYFLTLFINNDDEKTGNEVIPGEVNYNVVNVGMILNRPYDEYYVFVYDSESANSLYYSTIINNYESSADSKKIYFCNLGSALNKDYTATNEKPVNKNAQSISEFSFGEVTLLEIKNGKITHYIDDIENIKNALQ